MPTLERLTRIAQTARPVVTRGAGWALSNARRVAKLVVERGREIRSSSSTSTSAPAPPPPPATASPPPARPAPPPAPEPEPAHVEREAVLVAESADKQAADGAGAEIHVAEPWPGYGEMTAADIIDRLAAADAGTLGVVRLYEDLHRKRVTVIRETDRRLSAVSD